MIIRPLLVAHTALAACLVTLAGCAAVEPALVTQRFDAGTAAQQLLVTVRQTPGMPALRGADSARRYRTSRAYGQRSAVARALAAEYGMLSIVEWPIDVLAVDCLVFAIDNAAAVESLIERLSADVRVESVQAMGVFETLALAYDDPLSPLQSSLALLNLHNAHTVATGQGVAVAVIDTAVDIAHPDLNSRNILTRSFIPRSAPGDNTPVHGTAVAGIIAARAHNGIGIVGVAPAVSLLALEACWQDGESTRAAICNSFTLARALAFAIERQAAVINLSLSGPKDPLLARLIAKATAQGAIVVSADPGQVGAFPASLPEVLAVRSGEANAQDAVVRAPGREVLTLAPGGGYEYRSGSSMAAAHVSGIAALMLSYRQQTAPEVLSRILRTSSGSAAQAGIDVCAALHRLDAGTVCGTDRDVRNEQAIYGNRTEIPATTRLPATESP